MNTIREAFVIEEFGKVARKCRMSSVGITLGSIGFGPEGQGNQQKKLPPPVERYSEAVCNAGVFKLEGAVTRIEWREVHSRRKNPQLQVVVSGRKLVHPGEDLCRFSIRLPAWNDTAVRVRRMLTEESQANSPTAIDGLVLRLYALTASGQNPWKLEKGMPLSPEEVWTSPRSYIPSFVHFARAPSIIRQRLFVERKWRGDVYRLKAQLHPTSGEISFHCGVRDRQAFKDQLPSFGAVTERDVRDAVTLVVSAPETMTPEKDTEARLRLRAYRVLENFVDSDDDPEDFMEELKAAYTPRDVGRTDWSSYDPVDERLREGDLDTTTAQYTRGLANGVEVFLEYCERVAVMRVVSGESEDARHCDWVMKLPKDMSEEVAKELREEFIQAFKCITDAANLPIGAPEQQKRQEAADVLFRSAARYEDSRYLDDDGANFLEEMWGKNVSRSLKKVPGIIMREHVPSGPEQILMQIDGERRCSVRLYGVDGVGSPECFDELLLSVNPYKVGIIARNRAGGESSVLLPVSTSGEVIEVVRAFAEQFDAGPQPVLRRLQELGKVQTKLGGVGNTFRSGLPMPECRSDWDTYTTAADIVASFEKMYETSFGTSHVGARIRWRQHTGEAEIVLGDVDGSPYTVSIFCGRGGGTKLSITTGNLTPEESTGVAGKRLVFRCAIPRVPRFGGHDLDNKTLLGIGGFLHKSASGESNLLALIKWLTARKNRFPAS